jgi:hypothetical protein
MKFRKRPVEIEAVQWTGGNLEEIEALASGLRLVTQDEEKLLIHTLEGAMTANIGDWIIREGEVYPCKPDIFEDTYARVR